MIKDTLSDPHNRNISMTYDFTTYNQQNLEKITNVICGGILIVKLRSGNSEIIFRPLWIHLQALIQCGCFISDIGMDNTIARMFQRVMVIVCLIFFLIIRSGMEYVISMNRHLFLFMIETKNSPRFLDQIVYLRRKY